MGYKITLIPGDGIGPEIVREARKVLDAVGKKYGHEFDYTEILMGGCSIDAYGVPLTEEAVNTAKASDAVLLGAVGGNVGNSKWYDVAPNLRPEAGLLKIRKDLELFANIRPAYLYSELKDACPLKDEIIGDGFDMVIMRELTGGLYFGERHTESVNGVMTAVDTLTYNEEEIRRIAIKGFEIAMKRRKKRGLYSMTVLIKQMYLILQDSGEKLLLKCQRIIRKLKLLICLLITVQCSL